MTSPEPVPAGQRSAPVLAEELRDEAGTWTREWYCTPPQEGTAFTVLQAEWNPQWTVQRIYEVRLDDDR